MSAKGWAVIAVAVGVLLFWAAGPKYDKLAAKRVDEMMKEMKQGTGVEQQLAIGIWAKNHPKISDEQELAWAADHYDQFRKEKGIYRKLDSYKIVSSELVKDVTPPTAIVTVDIEGKTYKMRVPEKQPISWAE